NASARRSRVSLVFTLVVVGLASVAVVLWKHSREDQGHDHGEGPGHAALSLNHGKRWEVDAPLQTGMQRIRDAVTPVFAAHAQRRLTPDDARSLSASIQASASFL